MANLKGCFSHESDHWRTPSAMYKKYMDEGYIDPCPFHADFDGLKIDYFKKKLFINPPYSQLKIWVDYAIRQFVGGGGVKSCFSSLLGLTLYIFISF